jgi:putative spermidine/putrescine transport system ATP-binding protein
MTVVIAGLTKRYGGVTALDGVDLAIPRGSFTTLLGPSGSGKSTLLMCMAGFTEPTAGRILVDGRDVTGVLPEDRGFGVVFQGYALFPHMTVARNIGFPLRMRGRPRAEVADRVARMLRLVQLEGLAQRHPAELSGGQQQRVALARALAFEPEIVLLDEPLSALDRALRETLREELKRIHREAGATFILVTHDQEEALSLSDHVILLHEGRIVQQGAPEAIYRRPATLFAARFIGMTNLMPVAGAAEADGAVACTAPDGTRFLVAGALPADWRPGHPLSLSVRPESVTLAAAARPGPNVVAGTVAGRSFEGFDCLLDLDTALGRQRARLRARDPAAALRDGTAAWLHWPPEAGHLIAAA